LSAEAIRIVVEPVSVLPEIDSIPISFLVESVLDLRGGSPNRLGELRSRPVSTPYVKDYDKDAGPPSSWSTRFDVSRWGVVSAWVESRRVGSVVIAWDTPEADMLEGRQDLGVLWDLRVLPEFRRQGIGASMFCEAERWVATRSGKILKVETQDVNVGACRFYKQMGCHLEAIVPGAYPELPDETQLLWYKRWT
jgi:ribosomal protein S18 acetylase RimI-like enzyme